MGPPLEEGRQERHRIYSLMLMAILQRVLSTA